MPLNSSCFISNQTPQAERLGVSPQVFSFSNSFRLVRVRSKCMAAMSYLIGGYTVFIGVTLVYLYSLVSRQKSLEKEMETLTAIYDEE